jgi:hypothetical protein
LLGDITGSVVVIQRPIGFQYVWVWISIAHTCIRIHLTISTFGSELRKFLFALGIPKPNYSEIGTVRVSVFCEYENFERSETNYWSCFCKISMLCVYCFLKTHVKLF